MAVDPRNLVLNLAERGLSLSGYERDTIFLNEGGKKFVDISGITGLDSVSDGRGAVYADFDNDGDEDVFLPTVQGPAHLLFRNDIGQRKGWVRVSLVGSASGRDAYGATVRLKSSQGIQTKIKSGGEGFMSQHDPRLLFGIGDDQSAEWIEVRWPSGKVQRVEGPIGAHTHLLIDEATSSAKIVPPLPPVTLGGGSIAPAPPPRAADKALVLAGETTAGKSTRIELQGRSVVVLWATWCAMCREDLDTLVRSSDSLARQGYKVVAASVDEDPAAFRSFMARHHLPFQVVRLSADSRAALFRGGDIAVPAAVTTDAEGKLDQWLAGRPAVLRFINVSALAAADRRDRH